MLKLGMSVPDNKNVTHLLKIIKEAGFQCIMVTYLTDDEPIDEILSEAEKNALSISSLHAPIANINSFWQNGGEGDDYLEFIKKRVDFCREHDIRIMVAHTTFGNIIPAVSEIGFERFARLNDYAEEKGVCICYENVNETEVLKSVMERLSAFHGFCWDIGHNMAYAPLCDFNAKFKGKLKYVHIHDNFGVQKPGQAGVDLHFMPFTCNIDWQWYADKLNELGYTGDLNFESSYRQFLASDPEEFIYTAFDKMKKLKSLM